MQLLKPLSVVVDIINRSDQALKASHIFGGRSETWAIAGQSNGEGGGLGVFLYDAEDAPDTRIKEYSHGVDNTGKYFAAPLGELMTLRLPVQRGVAVGFALSFAKERLRLNPDIKEIIIVSVCHEGSGFTNASWGASEPYRDRLIDYLNDCLDKNPHSKLTGMIWQQGEADVSLTEAQYLTELNDLFAGVRGSVKGATNLPIIIGTMPETWIADDEAGRRQIDDAHRAYPATDTLSALTDLSAYDTVTDVHYTDAQQRLIGPDHAATAQALIHKNAYLPHIFKVIDGKAVDIWSGSNIFGSLSTYTDPDKGEVIDTGSAGYHTDMVLNPDGYTKAAWVKLKSNPSGFGSLISGTLTGSLTDSHYFGWDGYGHGGSDQTLNAGLDDELTIGEWVHVALTWDGAEFNFYVGGLLVENGTSNVNAITADNTVEIGTFDGLSSDNMSAYLHNMAVLPFPANLAGINYLKDM